MSIKSKLAAVALAALAVTGTVASSTQQAHAGNGLGLGLGLGLAAGVVGAAVVGSAVAANQGPYGYTYRRCGWVNQYNGYGAFVGRVRTCNY